MRARAVVGFALLLAACGSNHAEKGAPEQVLAPDPVPEPETPPQEDDPAPRATPTEDPETAARAAYLATIEAFNRVHGDEYFAGFSFPLACFYGKPDHPEKQFRAARAKHFPEDDPGPEYEVLDPEHGGVSVEVLVTVRASPGEVRLLDFGMYGDSEEWDIPRLHEKVILMRPVAGEWKIAGEFGKKIGKCDPALKTPIERPELVEQCAAKLKKCHKGCKHECEGDSHHACTTCQEQCIDDTALCFDPLEDPDENP